MFWIRFGRGVLFDPLKGRTHAKSRDYYRGCASALE